MLSAFTNTFKIPELRYRILFTLGLLVIVRAGVAITLPGVDSFVLDEWLERQKGLESNALTAMVNIFSGGGLQNCAIFALGIMPYISASIMMQLLTAVVPKLSKLSREDGGRQKITMYTRYGTIILCVFQGYLLAQSLENPGSNIFLPGLQDVINETGRPLVPEYGTWFVLMTVITVTAGTMFMMWIGEQITDRGIGNGISLIISANIVSALPGALANVWRTFVAGDDASAFGAIQLVVLFAFLIFVIAAVISITQAQRRIAVQYAKRVVGRKVYGGQAQYMPLKVNYAGVMPIIFAQAILYFPAQILSFMFNESNWVSDLANSMTTGWPYYVISGTLIFFFSYFWVATMFQPNQIAEDLKKSGGYIPGVRPGKPTAQFLDYTMGRLTFAGAIFLTIIAILPTMMAGILGIGQFTTQFFGGTSLLILVGVLLDLMRQIETHLLQRHYDGFLRKGRIRGRYDRQSSNTNMASKNAVLWIWVVIAVIIIAGLSYYSYQS